jgi:hypothetical protein
MSTYAPIDQVERQPTYRDKELGTLMKALRDEVRTLPKAKAALVKVEGRLRYVLKVLDLWDQTHAGRAELFLSLGDVPKANTSASLIFDADTRAALLRRAPIGSDRATGERLEENSLLEREVLE